MSRLKFIILISLSIIVAISLLLQLVMAHVTANAENRLRGAAQELQAGQVNYNQLQQIATWTAQVAGQKNDQDLRDLLARNNIQINTNAAPSAPAAPSSTEANPPSTH